MTSTGNCRLRHPQKNEHVGDRASDIQDGVEERFVADILTQWRCWKHYLTTRMLKHEAFS
jgi:hypothetical protein